MLSQLCRGGGGCVGESGGGGGGGVVSVSGSLAFSLDNDVPDSDACQ